VTATSRLVVVGASLAGVRAAEGLRRKGHTGALTLIGAEPHWPPYDRPPLSKQVLSQGADRPAERVKVDPALEVDLELGRRAIGLDVVQRQVRLDDDRLVDYDGLVVATGATVRRLPDTQDRANVHVVRTVEDADRLRSQLQAGRRVAVIGAGVLGCEIAATCRKLGLEVSLIDVFDAPMLRVLGPACAGAVADLHRRHGVRLLLGRQVLGLRGEAAVDAVLLDGDEVVETDLVVVSIGAVPETAWLEGSGLQLADGLMCDEACFALGSDRTIVAAGDVARWAHPLLGRAIRIEHWTNAASQAQVASQNLLAVVSGVGDVVPYAALPYYWSDQYDWKLQFIGTLGEDTVLEEGSPEDGKFVVTYHSEGRLVGMLSVNWPSMVPRWRPKIVAAAS
jgi:3-phenylpropionate/trans-cinnamate dioxygenase ferredoxin reductase subunit